MDVLSLTKKKKKKNPKMQYREEFSTLRSVVPNVSRSMDDADVLLKAVSYINKMKRRIEELELHVILSKSSEETENPAVIEVEVKMIGEEEALIRVESKNWMNAMGKLACGLRDLGLKILNGKMANLEGAVAVQTLVVEVPKQLGFNHEAIKQQLIAILHH